MCRKVVAEENSTTEKAQWKAVCSPGDIIKNILFPRLKVVNMPFPTPKQKWVSTLVQFQHTIISPPPLWLRGLSHSSQTDTQIFFQTQTLHAYTEDFYWTSHISFLPRDDPGSGFLGSFACPAGMYTLTLAA